jgi:hypothetical protein
MAIMETRMLRTVDLAGTFVLAIEGASIAATKDLSASRRPGLIDAASPSEHA